MSKFILKTSLTSTIILPLVVLAQDTKLKEMPAIAATPTAIVTPTVAATPAKPEFKPSGKVWGYAFGDYYYKLHADADDRGAGEYSNMKENSNAFELRRVYLGYDHQISERFSAELLLSNEKNYDASSNRTVFIKAANVRWKDFLPMSDLIIGQSATPTWAPVSEKAWGYRSVERTVVDLWKAGSSNDLGIALSGKMDSANSMGYNLMVGNGTGPKVEGDVFKKVYGDIYIKFLDQKLVLDLYMDYDKTQDKPYKKCKTITKLFVGYVSDKLTVGVEAFRQKQLNYTTYTDTVLGQSSHADVSPFAAAIFIRGKICKDKLSFFARADVYDPDSEYNADYLYPKAYSAYNTATFSVFGLDYTPHKNVHLIPNLWYMSYQSRLPGATGKDLMDYDLVPRFTFYYVFK